MAMFWNNWARVMAALAVFVCTASARASDTEGLGQSHDSATVTLGFDGQDDMVLVAHRGGSGFQHNTGFGFQSDSGFRFQRNSSFGFQQNFPGSGFRASNPA